jgi:hypothetical protein
VTRNHPLHDIPLPLMEIRVSPGGSHATIMPVQLRRAADIAAA